MLQIEHESASQIIILSVQKLDDLWHPLQSLDRIPQEEQKIKCNLFIDLIIHNLNLGTKFFFLLL